MVAACAIRVNALGRVGMTEEELRSFAAAIAGEVRRGKREAIRAQVRLGILIREIRAQVPGWGDLGAIFRRLGLHPRLAQRAAKLAEIVAPDGEIDDDRIDEILRRDGVREPRSASRRRFEQACGVRAKETTPRSGLRPNGSQTVGYRSLSLSPPEPGPRDSGAPALRWAHEVDGEIGPAALPSSRGAVGAAQLTLDELYSSVDQLRGSIPTAAEFAALDPALASRISQASRELFELITCGHLASR